jgi:two-component system cell cycle response regulator
MGEAAAGAVLDFELSAGMRLIDEYEDLLSFDVAQAEREAAVWEAAADAAGEQELLWRARLLRADMIERRGDLATAARIIADVLHWAILHGCTRVQSRAHRVLARLYRAMGDLAANLDHMLQCVTALDDTTPVSGRIACLVKLADAYAETGSVQGARERYEEAVRLAAEHGNVRRHLMALNNYAYAEYDQGDPVRSREVLQRLRSAGQEHGESLDFSALDTVARVEALLGNHSAARHAAESALTAYRTVIAVEADAEADLLLTLAFTQRLAGDLPAAQRTLAEVRERCEQHSLALINAQALAELAEVRAAEDDFRGAYRALRDFQAAQQRLQSMQRDAQARNRQALFEVAEARSQAAWFRDQANRDALTGLRNRRYVDENLPHLLRRAAADGSPLTAALVDLDHFKRINDTLSHQTGDQVLTTLATLLQGVDTGPGGFVARLGGEEFLLVIPGCDSHTAVAELERLRTTIAAHPWRPITGDLPVTASLGVSGATPDSTPSGLLSLADEALYRAKRAGRNRICLDIESRYRGQVTANPPPTSAVDHHLTQAFRSEMKS